VIAPITKVMQATIVIASMDMRSSYLVVVLAPQRAKSTASLRLAADQLIKDDSPGGGTRRGVYSPGRVTQAVDSEALMPPVRGLVSLLDSRLD
jgi:hypothetical protein